MTPSPSNCKNIMTEQNSPSNLGIAERDAIPQHIAERFGIIGFRTEKFVNHEDDSSKVDRCSDHPIMAKVLDRIHDAAMSVQTK